MNSLAVIYPLLATVAAYLVGSLSFAVIVSRAMGLNDPRTYGSKNPGATNVLRSGSKPAEGVTPVFTRLYCVCETTDSPFAGNTAAGQSLTRLLRMQAPRMTK